MELVRESPTPLMPLLRNNGNTPPKKFVPSNTLEADRFRDESHYQKFRNEVRVGVNSILIQMYHQKMDLHATKKKVKQLSHTLSERHKEVKELNRKFENEVKARQTDRQASLRQNIENSKALEARQVQFEELMKTKFETFAQERNDADAKNNLQVEIEELAPPQKTTPPKLTRARKAKLEINYDDYTQCQICHDYGKTSNLARHLKTHLKKEERATFVCDQCEPIAPTFLSKQALQGHLKRHHQVNEVWEYKLLIGDSCLSV